MKKKKMVPILVGIMSLLIVSSYFAAKADSSENNVASTTKIGVILPLTGELGNFGKTVLNGILLAVDDFTIKNPDRKIDLIVEDSQGKPSNAVSALRKLHDIDKVELVIGDLTSSATLALTPIANQLKILLMSPTASNPALSNSGPYFFRVWTSDSFDGKIASDYIKNDLHLKRAAILYLNNDYGVGLKKVFSNNFRNIGGEVVFEEGYLDSQRDFRTFLLKIRDAKPEVLYLPGQPQGIGNILKQCKELGVQLAIFSCVAAEDKEFLKIAGNAASGLVFTAPAFDMASERVPVKNFIANYEKRFNETPDTHAVHGYDAISIFLSGIEKNILSSNELKNFIHQTKKFTGLIGELSFDNNGDVLTGVAIKKYDNKCKINTIRIIIP